MHDLDLFTPSTDTGPELTVLSHGMGQDSATLLEMLIDDPRFRAKYAPGQLLVLFANTGDELPETYEHAQWTRQRCEDADIRFAQIDPEMGFHSESWQTLRDHYRLHRTCGSAAFRSSACTDQLKIQPIYRYIESYLASQYNVQIGQKRGLKQFAAEYGKLRVILGIAAGEEKRVAKGNHDPAWMRMAIEKVYPLIDLGMDRAACQSYLHSKGLRVWPSNCLACHFAASAEIEFMRRFYPEQLYDWANIEAEKLDRFRDREHVIATDKEGNIKYDRQGSPKIVNKNFGVFGVTTLFQKIEQVAIEYQEWSDERIREYRYSHGHCTSSY